MLRLPEISSPFVVPPAALAPVDVETMSPCNNYQSDERLPFLVHISFSLHSKLIGTQTVLALILRYAMVKL